MRLWLASPILTSMCPSTHPSKQLNRPSHPHGTGAGSPLHAFLNLILPSQSIFAPCGLWPAADQAGGPRARLAQVHCTWLAANCTGSLRGVVFMSSLFHPYPRPHLFSCRSAQKKHWPRWLLDARLLLRVMERRVYARQQSSGHTDMLSLCDVVRRECEAELQSALAQAHRDIVFFQVQDPAKVHPFDDLLKGTIDASRAGVRQHEHEECPQPSSREWDALLTPMLAWLIRSGSETTTCRYLRSLSTTALTVLIMLAPSLLFECVRKRNRRVLQTVLRLGGTAPRIAPSFAPWWRRLSQTSFSPIAWVS